MNELIRKLNGANMDIDLATPEGMILLARYAAKVQDTEKRKTSSETQNWCKSKR